MLLNVTIDKLFHNTTSLSISFEHLIVEKFIYSNKLNKIYNIRTKYTYLIGEKKTGEKWLILDVSD